MGEYSRIFRIFVNIRFEYSRIFGIFGIFANMPEYSRIFANMPETGFGGPRALPLSLYKGVLALDTEVLKLGRYLGALVDANM